MMWEAVANKTQATPFGILLDGVERLLFGYFHLSVGPTGDLHDHVQDIVVLISEEWDVMEI
jgi:hypothetical protein